jgi:hypothetical protein
VQPARCHGYQVVACTDTASPEQVAPRYDAHGESREIVLALRVHSGQLRRFAADQGAAGEATALGDARDDPFGDVDVQLAAAEVVEEKERLRTRGDHVVDAHGDQILANGAVTARCECDLELGAHAVGSADEQWLFDAARQGAQARETTDAALDQRRKGSCGERLDPLYQRIACVDVDTCLLVGKRHGAGLSAIGLSVLVSA